MTPEDLNFRHLLYFWSVAQEGSVVRGAERMGLSPQAVSTQLGQLERQLGQALFAAEGRSLKLTESGRLVLDYAEKIFHLGDQMRQALSARDSSRVRLCVGMTDAIPKLMSFRVLQGVLGPPLSPRLECIEGDLESLLGELAMNHLDIVIADRSAPERANVRFLSKKLGESRMALFASEALQARYGQGFPQCLQGAPVLLPGKNAPLRSAIDNWFAAHDIQPSVEGEFSDSALLKTFGRAGIGLFPAPLALTDDLFEQYGVRLVGAMDDVHEHWYAIAVSRRIQHPAWEQVLSHAAALPSGML